VRSSSRVGATDFGVNAKRLNYIAAGLRKKGWRIEEITEKTHPDYFYAATDAADQVCMYLSCRCYQNFWEHYDTYKDAFDAADQECMYSLLHLECHLISLSNLNLPGLFSTECGKR